MRLEKFPPLCPFGDSEADGVTLRRSTSKAAIWRVARNHFLRVNIYEDGDVTYLLGTRKEIQDDLLDTLYELEASIEIDGNGALVLRDTFKFARVAKALAHLY